MTRKKWEPADTLPSAECIRQRLAEEMVLCEQFRQMLEFVERVRAEPVPKIRSPEQRAADRAVDAATAEVVKAARKVVATPGKASYRFALRGSLNELDAALQTANAAPGPAE